MLDLFNRIKTIYRYEGIPSLRKHITNRLVKKEPILNWKSKEILKVPKKSQIKYKVLYLIPDRKVPCGGVTILNRHIELLLSKGVMVQKLELDGPLYEIKSKDSDLVTIIPEVWCDVVPITRKKIVFIQNHGLVPKEADLRKYNQVWTNSQFVRDNIIERFRMESFIIHNWLDSELFYPPLSKNNKEPKIAVMPRKGSEYVEKLIKDFFYIDFNIIGAFETESMGDSPDVVAKKLRESDVYIHTGFPEGMPLQVQEAMMSKCAVIGFTGGGGLEMMKDGKTALVCPDGDYVSLANAIKRILMDKSLIKKLGEAGYRHCKQYTKDHLFSQLEECFSKL